MGGNLERIMIFLKCPKQVVYRIFKSDQENLILAIEENDFQRIKYLHEDKNIQFFPINIIDGDPPLHIAIKNKNFQLVKYILKDQNNDQNIQKKQDYEILKFRDRILKEKNQYGDTPLMVATLQGEFQIVEYLVNRLHANINCKENEGNTPFIAACANGFMNIIEFLTNQSNINLNIKNKLGQTAIHRAAYFGQLLTIKYLLKNTFLDLLAKDNNGNNCLHLAAMNFNMTCLRFMIQFLQQPLENLIFLYNNEQMTPVDYLERSFYIIKEDNEQMATQEQIINYIIDKDQPPLLNEVKNSIKRQSKVTNVTFDGLNINNFTESNNQQSKSNISQFNQSQFSELLHIKGNMTKVRKSKQMKVEQLQQ